MRALRLGRWAFIGYVLERTITNVHIITCIYTYHLCMDMYIYILKLIVIITFKVIKYVQAVLVNSNFCFMCVMVFAHAQQAAYVPLLSPVQTTRMGVL